MRLLLCEIAATIAAGSAEEVEELVRKVVTVDDGCCVEADRLVKVLAVGGGLEAAVSFVTAVRGRLGGTSLNQLSGQYARKKVEQQIVPIIEAGLSFEYAEGAPPSPLLPPPAADADADLLFTSSTSSFDEELIPARQAPPAPPNPIVMSALAADPVSDPVLTPISIPEPDAQTQPVTATAAATTTRYKSLEFQQRQPQQKLEQNLEQKLDQQLKQT